jgi:putative DNA primase/helicase
LFFKHADGIKNLIGRLGSGLDLKTDGGYVVAAPSVGQLGSYSWVPGLTLGEIEPASWPDWLLQLARSKNGSHGHSNGNAPPIGEKIAHGTQHRTLVSLAGSMRRRGCDVEEIFAALWTMNVNRCEKPGTEEAIREIAASVCRLYPAGQAPPAANGTGRHHSSGSNLNATAETLVGVPDLLNGYDPEDVGNAQRFIAMWGAKAGWCPELAKWLLWDGKRWKADDGDQVRIWMQQTAMEFGIQALRANNPLAGFAAGCRRSSRITNALREAQPHLMISACQLDTDPWLLNFRNGTMDLRTGELMQHNADHNITKLIEYDYNPAAACPRFFKFLERITGGGPDASEADNERSSRLISYLQRAFGYSLTGVTGEKVVFLLHGPRDNGKSTLLALFLTLLGPYAVLLQIESLMARQQDTNNTQADLADLKSARFVMTSETEEGQRLAEGKLKRITQGMGRIKAVRKYENPIEFNETHKLWIDCNFLPVLRGYDEAIWRRLRTIPFNVVIPLAEQDKQLFTKLLTEAEGILGWAVAGAVEWHQYGLPAIPEIDQVTQQWRRDADQVGRFIENYCITARNAQVKARALYDAYKRWAEGSGERVEPEKKFSQRMRERGFEKQRTESHVLYLGIGLLAEAKE